MTGVESTGAGLAPSLGHEEAIIVILGLHRGIIEIRGLAVTFEADGDVDDGGVWAWTAKVWIDGYWYCASVPDHYPDGAAIDWSSVEDGGAA